MSADALVGIDVGGTKTQVLIETIGGEVLHDQVFATSGWRGRAVVEVPAVFGTAGITGIAVTPLLAVNLAVLTALVDHRELTVGDRKLALQALVSDPLVPDSVALPAILGTVRVAYLATQSRFAL